MSLGNLMNKKITKIFIRGIFRKHYPTRIFINQHKYVTMIWSNIYKLWRKLCTGADSSYYLGNMTAVRLKMYLTEQIGTEKI